MIGGRDFLGPQVTTRNVFLGPELAQRGHPEKN